jgi:hypothetical protein
MKLSDDHSASKCGLITLTWALVLCGLYASSRYSDLLFHNIVELAGVLVALLIFTLVWNTRRVLDNHYLLFIGIASLFSGILGLIHTYAYNAMGMFSGAAADLTAQLWIAFRYLSSISFLLAPLFIKRRVNVTATMASYAAATAILISAIFLGWFPVCYIEGTGMTPFKTSSEYVVSFILLASLGLLYRKRAAFEPGVFYFLGGSLLSFMVSGVSYLRDATILDSAGAAGHFFELLADYLIYRAVVVTGLVEPAKVLFRNLKQSEEALHRAKDELELRVRERTAELARSNTELQAEMAERKSAEERLVLLATAVGSAAEAVVITDPSTGVIQYVNPVFEQITGYAPQEALGRTLHFLESGKHDEEYFRGLRETLTRDGVWRGNFMNKKKDGTLYFEECSISPVRNSRGEIVNYVYLKRDVTERMRLDAVTESVKAMEDIGQIFSGLRNELGNPVNSINMILGILRNKLDSLPGEAVRNYLNLMTDQIARVEFLLRSLKSFNLYETQDLQNVEVPAFIDNFLPLVKEDCGRKGIDLSVTAARDAVWVRADPQALQQALLNVLNNASEAMNGRRDPKITVEVSRAGGMIRFRVADNGCGIAEDRMKNLFKPFYTTKEHGTGLGLVIVKKMLARMNGTIYIISRKDEGTSVDIELAEGTHAQP